MRYPDFSFADTAFGDVDRRNNIKPLHALKGSLPAEPKDCYATWHRFPQAYADHCRQTGSVSKWSGSSYADFIPLDIDSPDLDLAVVLLRDFLKQLEVTYEIDGFHGVRVYFSGKKGFHVLLDAALFGGWNPSPQLAGHLRATALKIAGSLKIDAAIYDQNRLFRLPNTINSKSGLFKVPLTPSEAIGSSAVEIQLLAKAPRSIPYPDWGDCDSSPVCLSTWQASQSTSLKIPKKDTGSSSTLFPAKMKEGEGRDQAAFKIARSLRDSKVPKSMALEILKLWDSTQESPLTQTDGADILEKKIANAYGAQENEPDTVTVADIKTVDELGAVYRAYISKVKTRKVFLGWPEVDTAMRGIAPGEVLTIIAKSGVGKSVVLQNILRHLARTQPDTISLFCSLEQPLAQCFERYAQMVLGLEGRVIEDRWTRDENSEALEATVSRELGPHTLTCGKGGLSLDQVEQALEAAKEKTGQPVNVLAIDYLGLLDTAELERTLYGQISRAARRLKDLAKKHDLVLILLCQVSRAAGEAGNTPLTLYSARESGAIEESADFLLGLYRPDLKSDNQMMAIQILKNRKGMYGVEYLYEFDSKSLRVTSPTNTPALAARIPYPKDEPMMEVVV